jgi:hypothetical protein
MYTILAITQYKTRNNKCVRWKDSNCRTSEASILLLDFYERMNLLYKMLTQWYIILSKVALLLPWYRVVLVLRSEWCNETKYLSTGIPSHSRTVCILLSTAPERKELEILNEKILYRPVYK